MNVKLCRESLMRARSYFMRNDTERGLTAAIAALQKLGTTTAPTDLRSLCRECVSYVQMGPTMKAAHAPALVYTPGKEAALCTQMQQALQHLRKGSVEEDFDAALARKIKLDQTLNEGKSLLASGRTGDADAKFTEALGFYKDEHRVFYVIARAMLDAHEIVRALPYIKQGLAAAPKDVQLHSMLLECARIRDELRARRQTTQPAPAPRAE